MAGAAVALAVAACGSPVGAATPTPGPVTADSIRAAVDNSTMDNAHFTLHGTVIKDRTYYPVTGDGVLQARPVEALEMQVYLQTFTSRGTIRIQEVTIGGKLYTRGAGKWTSKPTSETPIAFTSYVAEEIIDGAGVWHARSAATHSTYDVWVRESDGYIVKIAYVGIAGNYTMNFDSYNKSRVIATPKN